MRKVFLVLVTVFVMGGCSLPVADYEWKKAEELCTEHKGARSIDSGFMVTKCMCHDGTYKEWQN